MAERVERPLQIQRDDPFELVFAGVGEPLPDVHARSGDESAGPETFGFEAPEEALDRFAGANVHTPGNSGPAFGADCGSYRLGRDFIPIGDHYPRPRPGRQPGARFADPGGAADHDYVHPVEGEGRGGGIHSARIIARDNSCPVI